MHVQASYASPCGPATLNIDGTVSGTFNNSTHKLTVSASPGLTLSYMGTFLDSMNMVGAWQDTTNALTLT